MLALGETVNVHICNACNEVFGNSCRHVSWDQALKGGWGPQVQAINLCWQEGSIVRFASFPKVLAQCAQMYYNMPSLEAFPLAELKHRDWTCRHRELELMREGAMLINFARGEVIDKQVRRSFVSCSYRVLQTSLLWKQHLPVVSLTVITPCLTVEQPRTAAP